MTKYMSENTSDTTNGTTHTADHSVDPVLKADNHAGPVLRLEGISKRYLSADDSVLKNVSLSVSRAEFVALLGPSGSGKSTLLHIAGLLDAPNAGKVCICGDYVENLSDDARTKVRLTKLGFVYQYHHLLQEFSAAENVALPQLLLGTPKKIAREKAESLLEQVGLAAKINALPSELSGGQRQRVAIARAMANDPAILLADEPTGNLDSETATAVFDDLLKMAQANGMAAIIATHNEELVAKMDRTYYISDGRLLEKI